MSVPRPAQPRVRKAPLRHLPRHRHEQPHRPTRPVHLHLPQAKDEAVSDIHSTTHELATHYRALLLALDPTAGTSSNGYTPPVKPSSRPPLRIEVSDEIREVDRTADDVAQRARDLLGFQHRLADTLPTLRAIPALLEALTDYDAGKLHDRLEQVRRSARITLGIDPRPLRLDAACPQCFGFEAVPLALRRTLLANVEEGRVWCSNKTCGYRCGLDYCWCAPDDATRLHRMEWTRRDLLRLGLLLDEEVSA